MSDRDPRGGAGADPTAPPDETAAAHDAWGGAFRAAWRDARPAGRRRAAQLAVGLPRLDLVIEPGARMPLRAPPSSEAWAAGVRHDGTFARGAAESDRPPAAGVRQ